MSVSNVAWYVLILIYTYLERLACDLYNSQPRCAIKMN